MKELKNTEQGFTLVELIVSMGLFIVVVFGTTSALLTMLDASRKAQAMRTAMEGLGFALDDVARTVRVGWDYRCVNTGSPPLDEILTFAACGTNGGVNLLIETDKGTVRYTITEANGSVKGDIKKTFAPYGGTTDPAYTNLVLTPPEMSITDAKFYVLGDPSTGDQPRVVIVVKGIAGDKVGFQSEFLVQTSVAARLPNASGA